MNYGAMRSDFRIRRGAQRVRLCLGIAVTIGSAACAPSPDPSTLTVDYYRAHNEMREAKLAECRNDPGGIGSTTGCINAREAARIEDLGSLRDLPPLGLPGENPRAGKSSGEEASH